MKVLDEDVSTLMKSIVWDEQTKQVDLSISDCP